MPQTSFLVSSLKLHMDTNSHCFGKCRAPHIPHGRYSVPSSSGARPDLMRNEMVSKNPLKLVKMNMILFDKDHLGLAGTQAHCSENRKVRWKELDIAWLSDRPTLLQYVANGGREQMTSAASNAICATRKGNAATNSSNPRRHAVRRHKLRHQCLYRHRSRHGKNSHMFTVFTIVEANSLLGILQWSIFPSHFVFTEAPLCVSTFNVRRSRSHEVISSHFETFRVISSSSHFNPMSIWSFWILLAHLCLRCLRRTEKPTLETTSLSGISVSATLCSSFQQAWRVNSSKEIHTIVYLEGFYMDRMCNLHSNLHSKFSAVQHRAASCNVVLDLVLPIHQIAGAFQARGHKGHRLELRTTKEKYLVCVCSICI